MTASLTFTGSGGAAYTVPGTHVAVDGTWAYDSDGVGLVSSGSFARLLDTTACTGTSSCEVQFDLPATAAFWTTAAITFLDSSLNGVGVNVRGDAIVVEKIVAGSGTTTLSTLSTPTSGVFTLKVELNISTGAIVVYKNTVSVITTSYTDFLSNLRAGVTTYRDNSIAVVANTLVTVTGGTPSASIDSYPATIRSGSSGNAYATTGLSSVSGITIGSLAATSISDTAGDGTHSVPSLADGVAHELYGTKTVTISGTGGSPTTTTSFQPLTTQNFVTLSGTLNTTNTGVLYNLSPAAVVGDQIVFLTANNTYVDAQGNFGTDLSGTQTLWHIQASTGIARSYSLITGVIGTAGTATPGGVAATASVGSATASGGGKATPSAPGMTAAVGTAVGKGGGTSAPSSLGVTSAVGTAVGNGGGTAVATGIQATLSLGTVIAIGTGSTAGNATTAGVQASTAVGTVVASGGATASATSPGLSSFVGSVIARGGALVAVIGLQIRAFVGVIGHPPEPEDNSLRLDKSDVRLYDKASPAADRVDLGAILADLDSRLSTLESKVDQLER